MKGMLKYKLVLEYDGTNYRGWQTQQNARSIQGTLTEAARKVLGAEADIQGAGRTDAGVHALGQVAHLATARAMPARRLREGLNDALPAGINILHIEEAPADFHARHDAVARRYLYLISRRRTAFAKRYVWWVKDTLDVRKMESAAAAFRGFHNFASFADKRTERGQSTLAKIDVMELKEMGELIVLHVMGSHFLWKMVRRMTGILVEAGRANIGRRDIEGMLDHRSDMPARHTAPPSGLFLAQVLYAGETPGPLHLPVFPLFGVPMR